MRKNINSLIICCVMFMALMSGCSHRTALKSLVEEPGSGCGCTEEYKYTLYPGDKIELLCTKRLAPVDNYAIQVEDRITINFPSHQHYTFSQMVKPDGTINIPRLGPVKVAGKEVHKIHDEILARFTEVKWTPEFFVQIEDFDTGLDALKNVFTHSNSAKGREIIVRPDGFINIPFIGELPVSGKSVSAVREQIADTVASIYPRLRIDIQVMESHQENVFIYGEVNRPGAYDISQTTTVFELIAHAGGYLPSAVQTGIFVISTSEDSVACRYVKLKHENPSECTTLCPGEIIYIPKKKVNTLAELMENISQILFFRGYGFGLQWNVEDMGIFNN